MWNEPLELNIRGRFKVASIQNRAERDEDTRIQICYGPQDPPH
jgi:hypothetical protein